MGKPESRLVSLRDSRTFDLIASLSQILANASSSWIASFSQFLDSSRNIAFNCGVRAAIANWAQSMLAVFLGIAWHNIAPLQEHRRSAVDAFVSAVVRRVNCGG